MPYIPTKDRLDAEREPQDAGELTYKLYVTCRRYAFQFGKPRFATLCTVFGALACTALELYRRIAAPYEDSKIAENGDAF